MRLQRFTTSLKFSHLLVRFNRGARAIEYANHAGCERLNSLA
jgi:hypothetical protein